MPPDEVSWSAVVALVAHEGGLSADEAAALVEPLRPPAGPGPARRPGLSLDGAVALVDRVLGGLGDHGGEPA